MTAQFEHGEDSCVKTMTEYNIFILFLNNREALLLLSLVNQWSVIHSVLLLTSNAVLLCIIK